MEPTHEDAPRAVTREAQEVSTWTDDRTSVARRKRRVIPPPTKPSTHAETRSATALSRCLIAPTKVFGDQRDSASMLFGSASGVAAGRIYGGDA